MKSYRIKVLSRSQILSLIRRTLKPIGVTLPQFRKWNRDRRHRTMAGCHVDMMLAMLRFSDRRAIVRR